MRPQLTSHVELFTELLEYAHNMATGFPRVTQEKKAEATTPFISQPRKSHTITHTVLHWSHKSGLVHMAGAYTRASTAQVRTIQGHWWTSSQTSKCFIQDASTGLWNISFRSLECGQISLENKVTCFIDLLGAMYDDSPRVESRDVGTNLESSVQPVLLGALNRRSVCRRKEKAAMIILQRRAGRKIQKKKMARHQDIKVETIHIRPNCEGAGSCTACLSFNYGSRVCSQIQMNGKWLYSDTLGKTIFIVHFTF